MSVCYLPVVVAVHRPLFAHSVPSQADASIQCSALAVFALTALLLRVTLRCFPRCRWKSSGIRRLGLIRLAMVSFRSRTGKVHGGHVTDDVLFFPLSVSVSVPVELSFPRNRVTDFGVSVFPSFPLWSFCAVPKIEWLELGIKRKATCHGETR